MDELIIIDIASQLHAMSHPTRYRIFKSLPPPGGPMLHVHMLGSILQIKPSTLSKHLNILLRSGLIQVKQVSQYKQYTQDHKAMQILIDHLQLLVPKEHPHE